MTRTITTTLADYLYEFVDKESKEKETTKKSIIQKSLKLYRKKQLEKQIEKGFKERYDEYKELNDEFLDVQSKSISKE